MLYASRIHDAIRIRVTQDPKTCTGKEENNKLTKRHCIWFRVLMIGFRSLPT